MNPAIAPDLPPALAQRMQALSPEQIAEVANFVDFLVAKTAKQAAMQRLLAVGERLQAAGAEPLEPADVRAELAAIRQAQRQRRSL